MAELLIRVVSKTNAADPYRDAKLAKRGDVICVQADGWSWSEMEKTNPDWRILKWPSVSVSEASLLLTPELPTAAKVSGDMPDDPMLQLRGFHLDIDAATMPKALRTYLADATRKQPFVIMPSQITVAALKRQKAKRSNPAVIG